MSKPKGVKPSKGAPPLERSSYEFMVALVMASIIQLIPDWVAYTCCCTALAGVGIYFCWFSRGTVDYGAWRKIFLSLCCVVFMFSVTYSQIIDRYRDSNVIPPTVLYMTQWGQPPGTPPLVINGTPPHVVSGYPGAVVTVDGRLLVKYKSRFNLMVVTFHIINAESYMDKDSISKSKIVKIRPEDIIINISYNEQYLEEVELGVSTETFVLLAVPLKMRAEDFTTLNDAEDKGAQIIGTGSASGEVEASPTLRK